MAHESSLKGLLKPFKGNRDYSELEEGARGALDKLNLMMQRLVTLTEHQHVSHKNIVLRLHKAKSGQGYLRWRTLRHAVDQSMGFMLWKAVVNDPLTGPQTRQNLLILEQQRIALNMQASVLQYVIRQASDCSGKVQLAQQAVG
ncbi:hypothetical protein BVH03_17630 [Pseudomonas sp. PA15(2017)]|nr:hypothetical protein BVH03_17630 [Pseudomonas sp. PA15(2017)]